MKTLFITLLCVYSALFYGQSAEETNSMNVFNDRILKTIPSLVGTDYFIFKPGIGLTEYCVVTKSNNDYIFYDLQNKSKEYTLEVKQTKIINSKHQPALDTIFNNLTLKPGVKRYMSEYGIGRHDYVISFYCFLLFKNGIKTIEFWLPTHEENGVTIEGPIDHNSMDFLFRYCGFYPDGL